MLIDGKSIRDILLETLTMAKEFEGGYKRLIVLVICLIIIVVINRKDIGKICVPTALSIVVLFVPYLYVYLYQDTSYKRFFWILPEAILLSYTIILVVSKLSKDWLKIAFITIVSSVIMLTGNSIYSTEAGLYRKSQNSLQVEQSVVDLADAIINIDPEPTCVVPYNAVEMLRVANPNIVMAAGRNSIGFMGCPDPLTVRLIDNISYENPDSDFVFSLAQSRNIKFVITMACCNIDIDVCNQYGYDCYGEIGEYLIYYNSNPAPEHEEWYVTQYGPNWGKNYFYTIEDSYGNLVIIDGGHYGNAALLASIIRDHNYHVSAWIFTNLSDQHIGAAYRLFNETSELFTVDKIYIQDYTDEMLESVNSHQGDWSGPELSIASDFVQMINNMNNTTYLDINSDYNLIGLNMHIFHYWDESSVINNGLEPFDGSLVFSVEGHEDSMLFTSYTTPDVQDSIFASIGDNQFEYITVNCHGGWVYDYSWYDARNPRGLFIDVGIDTITSDWSAFNYYSYAIEKGYNVYTFATVPNRITLR